MSYLKYDRHTPWVPNENRCNQPESESANHTKSPRMSDNNAAEVAASLDLLIERKRELFKIEDQRLSTVETQGAAAAASALAGLAVVGAALNRAFDLHTAQLPPLALAVLAAACGLLALLFSVRSRQEYPTLPQTWRREQEPPVALVTEIPVVAREQRT